VTHLDLSSCPETVIDGFARLSRLSDRGYTFVDGAGKATTLGFAEFWAASERRARRLLGTGLQPGDRVAVVLSQPQDFIVSFLGALIARLVPVPMYPPLSFGKLDAYVDAAVGIMQAAGARLLLTDGQLASVLWQVVPRVSTIRDLYTVDRLDKVEPASGELPTVTGADLAFLQFTSGSTSAPKGVMVTHANLVANTWEIAHRIGLDERDTVVSWLPLYHDMGLIGMVITPLMVGARAVFIPTLTFVKRPNSWMQAMHDWRGSVSFAPNFAFALAGKRAGEKELSSWDLSCVRLLGCGAEPIHAGVIEEFERRLAPAGLARGTSMAAYGMAEATLAMAFSPIQTPITALHVDAEAFRATGTVLPPGDDAVALPFVNCGKPFRGHELRAMSTDGALLGDGVEGEIVHRGASVTPGYWENREATAENYRDGWLHTGDLGFTLDGDVFITGRSKDLIILNGRNHHPQSIEWAVQEVDGVRKGNVVCFSRPGPDTEELVVVCETRPGTGPEVQDAVVRTVADALSLKVADVVLLAPGQLPKTSSGKVQRRKTREQYLRGELGTEGVRTMGAAGEGLTVARHFARSLWGRASHTVGRAFSRNENPALE
jgi:fatty-acyl-CoA synthase